MMKKEKVKVDKRIKIVLTLTVIVLMAVLLSSFFFYNEIKYGFLRILNRNISLEKKINIYEDFYKENPNFEHVQEKLGDYYLEITELFPDNETFFLSAMKYYNKMLEKDPEKLKALEGMAKIYLLRQDFVKAEESYSLLNSLYPDVPEYSVRMAEILIFKHEEARALEILEKAAKNAPRSFEINFLMAKIYGRLGDMQKTIEFYRTAILLAIEQRNPFMEIKARFNLGKAYERGKLLPEASNQFQYLIDMRKDVTAFYVEKARICFQQGLFKKTISTIINSPVNPISWELSQFKLNLTPEKKREVYNLLGLSYFRTGDYSRAVDTFEKLAAISPGRKFGFLPVLRKLSEKQKEFVLSELSEEDKGFLELEDDSVEYQISELVRNHEVINTDNTTISLTLAQQIASESVSGKLSPEAELIWGSGDIYNFYPIGSVVEGEIIRVDDLGVDLELSNGIKGRVDTEDISWDILPIHTDDLFSRGQKTEAYVKGINAKEKVLELGIKQLSVDPWEAAGNSYKKGDIFSAKYRLLSDKGLYMDIGNGVTGFVDIQDVPANMLGEISNGQLSKDVEFDVVVKKVSSNARMVLLSIEKTEKDIYNQLEEKVTDFYPGQEVLARITGIKDYEIALETEDGYSGRISLSGNMSGSFLSVGQEIEVIILSPSSGGQPAQMEIKKAEAVFWEAVKAKYSVGMFCECKVVDVFNDMAFVELKDGANGTIFFTDKINGDTLILGKKIKGKIEGFDEKFRCIILKPVDIRLKEAQ